MYRKYSDEFKLAVIEDYYNSPLGVRSIANKYDLPSKNYIGNWEKQLKKKGLLPQDATKPVKTMGRAKESILRQDDRTPREKHLEEENYALKAKIKYYENLESLQPFIKKKQEIKYEAILKLSLEFPVKLLCQIAGVSRSGFYKYKKKPLDNYTEIEDLIIDIHKKSKRRAGYRFIKEKLKNKYNLIVNHKKILRIMRENSIYSVLTPKTKRYKGPIETKENILARDFTAKEPGKKFVTDITYISTPRKTLYLCVIMDLFNREPVVWNLSDSLDRRLSVDAIKKLKTKFDLKGSLIHSDRGIHYTNKEYVDLLKESKVIQSMSRKGNCWDNAPAESFFARYKCEQIYPMKKQLRSFEDVKDATDEFMEYYITERPHSTLGGLTPKMFKENHYITSKKPIILPVPKVSTNLVAH